ncbi:helix-turn-helix domain-containing protein [Solwaraspora sp. WMMB335]|uniref:helix-turn-helix domain-containing protein n=1 Tax=Solwaraspora sp. WMMB335 TaxID=3404118 RepID=UPI003B94732E
MTGQNRRIGEKDSGADRLRDFVADLARLRRDAGQPSLRTMAVKAHYSHTALSSVLAGTRLPSQELTLAFVRACGGDEDAWRARWHRENACLRAGEPATAETGTIGRPVLARSPRPARWPVVSVVAITVLSAVVLSAVALVALTSGTGPFAQQRDDTALAGPSSGRPVADGADPQEEQCHVDAMSAQTVPIPDRDPRLAPYGSLTLRYSPRCQAAWPLFVSTERVPTGATIRLVTTRPSDGAVSRFDYPFLVPSQVYSVYGNVLRTTQGCVMVAVEITAVDTRTSLGSADTSCTHLGTLD